MKLHRWLNTFLVCGVLLGGLGASSYAYGMYQDILLAQGHASEMAQIVSDEGFRSCRYKDSKGLGTVGFGHLILPNENLTCVTPQKAIILLQNDYYIAWAAVEKHFPWAEGEVKLVLTNMSYQIGITKLRKFKKTLKFLKEENYTNASMEMIDSKWYKETPKRAMRLAVRILALEDSHGN